MHRDGNVERGELGIGSERNAILQIQESQSTDPFRALREIVNNGIDNNDNPVINITRFKRKGRMELIIEDNGKGIPPGDDGNCDMRRVATSICDSQKAHLTESERDKENVVGKFAIGLHGYGGIGKFIDIVSRCKGADKVKVLSMQRGTIDYSIKTFGLGAKQSIGTKVHIYPIHDTIATRFTVEKLNVFLKDALSERLIQSKAKITIYDKVSKKSLEVKPYYFKGEKISVERVALPSRDGQKREINLELYINPKKDHVGKVSVLSQGVKVVDDISSRHEFNHEPWNNPLLEGRISNKYLTLPPATRDDIVVDDNLKEFVSALGEVEEDIKAVLKVAEEKKEEKLNKTLMKHLRTSVINVMNLLGSEYSWFGKYGSKVDIKKDVDGMGVTPPTKKEKKKFKTPVSDGPLSYIRAYPRFNALLPGQSVTINASAWTSESHQIISGVRYKWEVKNQFMGDTSQNVAGDKFTFTAGDTHGKVKVKVTATLMYHGQKQKEKATCEIEIVSEKQKKKLYEGARFPVPRALYRPGENWRSRWSGDLSTIEYNTGHPDFKLAEKEGRVIRYMQMIYTKQIVLHNFKGTSEDLLLERMVEVMNLFDSKLHKENKKKNGKKEDDKKDG